MNGNALEGQHQQQWSQEFGLVPRSLYDMMYVDRCIPHTIGSLSICNEKELQNEHRVTEIRC